MEQPLVLVGKPRLMSLVEDGRGECLWAEASSDVNLRASSQEYSQPGFLVSAVSRHIPKPYHFSRSARIEPFIGHILLLDSGRAKTSSMKEDINLSDALCKRLSRT